MATKKKVVTRTQPIKIQYGIEKKTTSFPVKLPVPHIAWWENHLGKFNYRMVGGIVNDPETIGGGANQGFDSWNGVVKNIKSQAAFKGVNATVTKSAVTYWTVFEAEGKITHRKDHVVPVFKVKKPR